MTVSPDRRVGTPALLWTYAALGALAGGGESLFVIFGLDSPSVLRRLPGLVLTAALFYALPGLAAGAVHVLYQRSRRGAAASFWMVNLQVIGMLAVAVPFLFSIEKFLFRSFVPVRPSWILQGTIAAASAATLFLLWLLYRRLTALAFRSALAASALEWSRRGLMGAGIALVAGAALGLLWSGPWRLPLAPAAGARMPASAGGPSRPNILLVLVDTLRADRIAAYGLRPAVSPGADALAARGALFQNAYSPCSWTTPAVVSMLTSRYPSEHGVTDFEARVPRRLPYLPEVLAAGGYETAAVVGNPLLGHSGGFDRGYDIYDTYPGSVERSLLLVSAGNSLLRAGVKLPLHRRVKLYPRLGLVFPPRVRVGLSDYMRGDEVTDLSLSMLDSLRRKPFFLYVHYGDPHTPYLHHPYGYLPRPAEIAPERRDEVIETYDEEAEFVDGEIARLVDGLEARGLAESTIVVLVADHGEEFLEHGVWEHGHNLHEQVLRVPLILAGPGIPRGRRRDEPVDLLDVAPTLVDLAGLPRVKGFRGRALFSPRAPGVGAHDRPLLSQVSLATLSKTRQASLLRGGWRYIRYKSRSPEKGVREELFDRARDPEELNDLAPAEPERLARMREMLRAIRKGLSSQDDTEVEPDEEMLERLKSLGYVN